MATTLTQFRAAVSSELGLENTTAADQGFIDLWVNEGVTDFVLRTKCYSVTGTISLTASVSDYTLDTSWLLIDQAYVTVGSTPYYMERTDVDSLLAMRRTSVTNTSPAQYYAVAGANRFMVYPTPASADTVTLYGVGRPTTLSVSSDTPSEIPAEFQKAVEFFACRRGASQSDDSTSQNGQAYMAYYEQEVRRAKRLVAFKGGHRLPLASVRSRVYGLPFHDRSRYPG